MSKLYKFDWFKKRLPHPTNGSIPDFIKGITFIKPQYMNVKISPKGRMLINNKVLASQVVKSIIDNKSKLETGQVVHVTGSFGVKSVTTIIDTSNKKAK